MYAADTLVLPIGKEKKVRGPTVLLCSRPEIAAPCR